MGMFVKSGRETEWREAEWADECPKCESGVEILTDTEDGMGNVGDQARCTGCGHEGCLAVHSENGAYIDWN